VRTIDDRALETRQRQGAAIEEAKYRYWYRLCMVRRATTRGSLGDKTGRRAGIDDEDADVGQTCCNYGRSLPPRPPRARAIVPRVHRRGASTCTSCCATACTSRSSSRTLKTSLPRALIFLDVAKISEMFDRFASEKHSLSARRSVLACDRIVRDMNTTFARIRAIRVDGTPTKVDGLTAERVRRCIIRVLDGTTLGAWATVTRSGEAHINTAYFSYSDDLVLHFMSHPHSLHCLNVNANSSMAVAIFASEQKWTDPGRGLQLFGRCNQVRGEDAAKAIRVYGQRFRPYADWQDSLKPGDAALDYRFYRFVPHTVKVLDEAEFGDAVWIQVQVERRL
jgi:uncharacterized protein YhbP (UPF0306 family)